MSLVGFCANLVIMKCYMLPYSTDIRRCLIKLRDLNVTNFSLGASSDKLSVLGVAL